MAAVRLERTALRYGFRVAACNNRKGDGGFREFGDKLLLGPLIVAANRNDDNNVYISQTPFTITLLSL